jgi:hypothetical protein
MEKKPGDDQGQNTKVWGPPGWLFLHCIAQNFPWEPDQAKKDSYLKFFRLLGDVLPCRYCRDSYQQFIEEPCTKLDESVVQNRKTMVKWLYSIHNKVNKKLGVSEVPCLQEVWDRYESFRSQCKKSPKVVETAPKGCTEPVKGLTKKKCIIQIKDVRETSFGKSSGKKKIKLISIKKSNKSGKKFMATFDTNGRKKVIHFGAGGMSDFTKHHDIQRRNRYIFRHQKDTKTGDPSRAGYLSLFVLWNKPSLQGSIADYRRRLNVYNRTGKFPTNISGYKSPGKKKKYQ